MEVFKLKKELISYVERNREMGKIIGFAPTMGALHDGHLSLYENARKENDLVICSIFVNPTQFNNAEDLQKYPRTIEQDILLLENSKLVDAVYIPRIEDIYPDNLSSKSYDFDGIENEMEGQSRPGHFDGVGTVVQELFNQVRPHNAYFGEKDFQQLAIIRKLVEVENISVQIHGVPTKRNDNGLALSSRNKRLSKEQQLQATLISKTLNEVNEWFKVLSIAEINERVKNIFETEKSMELEYFVIADENNLKPTDFHYKDKSYRAFIVAHIGGIRLIDNLHLD